MDDTVRRRPRLEFLIVPAALYLAALYGYPVLETLRIAFGSPKAAANFTDILSQRSTWTVFGQTLDMAVVVTLLCLIVSYPLAYLLVAVPPRAQQVLVSLVLLPYWISTLVRSYAWIAILGRNGMVNWLIGALGLADGPFELLYNRFGATVGMVNVVTPIMVLVLYAAFSRIDRRLLRIGGILGGHPLFVFGRVWLPLSIPGVASGCIIVFLFSLGVFTTPAILGGAGETSVAMAIEQQVGTMLDLPAAASLSTLLLVLTFVLLGLTQRYWLAALLGGASSSVAGTKLTAAIFDGLARLRPRGDAVPSRRWNGAGGSVILWIVGGLGLLYMLAPVFVVIGLSFSSADFMQFPPRHLSLRWFTGFFGSSAWVGAAIRSFIVAFIATAIVTILGIATAYGLERSTLGKRRWIYVLFLSPLVMPPTILAFGLYYVYARLGLIGSLPALGAAHVVIVLPLVLVTLCQGLRAIDPAVEFAADSLGAGPLYKFRRVTLPLLGTAIVSGGLLAFLTSFDELILSLFPTSPRSVTLPKRMWDSVRFEIDPTNAAAATLLIALSILILGALLAIGAYRRPAAH